MPALPHPRTFPASLGPFRMIEPIGQGGFAPVWRAEEVHEGRKLRDVAVKIFFLTPSIEPASVEAARWLDQVIDEACALCRVEHPNVVRFHTLQRDDARGIVGLVMERVAGDNLGVVLRRRGALDERDVLEIGISVAWALAAVHDAGLVHRDVKPENIIRTASGYKLIDFGIVVKSPDGGHSGEEEPPPLSGTLGYIAPEHLLDPLTFPSPASDLYALGVTLTVLARGRMPDGAAEVAPRSGVSTSRERPAPASLLDLARILLDPDPSARPRHAEWVARELERLRAGLAPEPAIHAPSPDSGPLAHAPALERLLAVEHRAPDSLVPIFAELRRACEEQGRSAADRVLRELGLSVMRYAFALGMALVTATSAPPAIPPGSPIAEALRGASERSSWLPLLRALHEALLAADPPSAGLLAFAARASLEDRLEVLLRGADPAPGGWVEWLADILDGAAQLLAVPRAGAAHAAFGERLVKLDPWLPLNGGRWVLPELPAAPGKPWRLADPVSGKRREYPPLDQAVHRLLGVDEMHRETGFVPNRCPPFAGRDDALEAIDRAAREAQQGHARLVLLTGPLGIGRTRLLDAAIERAGVAPERTLRAHGSPERRSPLRPLLSGLRALGGGAFQLLEGALDRALSPAVLPAPQQGDEAIEAALDALLLAAAEEPAILAVDDVQWVDDHTLKLLQLLVDRSDRGARAKLLVLAAARDEPHPSPPLRALLGAIKGRARRGTAHLALGPLTVEQAAAVAQGVCPVDPGVERAVVRSSGRVPFFLVSALSAWSETGAIVWHDGAFRAADERRLDEGLPGVAALVEAQLGSYFAPNSPSWRAALRALAAVALHGGGLPAEALYRVVGDDEDIDTELETLAGAGILVISGEPQEYGFAQEMVRQATLNLVRQKPWLHRLHRALLQAIAEGPDADEDAAFLAAGYEKLGDRGQARAWLARAMESAARAGLFGEAMGFGDRLAALTADPAARAEVELATLRALVEGRQFKLAKELLQALRPAAAPGDGPVAAQDLRWRIVRLEIARGLSEAEEDPELLAEADALADPVLACEARMALAGVATGEEALALAGEAVALAERAGPALEFRARVLRVELIYAANTRDLREAERDLRRALAIAHATSSLWQQIHIEGDLAVIEAELGQLGAAIERLHRLAADAEARGMRGQLRMLLHNLSACLIRAGRTAESAEAARRTADLAAEAGDPKLHGTALSLRAYALLCTGDLEEALTSASEADWIQRERDDPMRAQTLLRRAAILDALDRTDEALTDALEAQELARLHDEAGFFVTGVLWEKLFLAQRGEIPLAELAEALAAARASGVAQRALTRRLIDQASAWLARATSPIPR